MRLNLLKTMLSAGLMVATLATLNAPVQASFTPSALHAPAPVLPAPVQPPVKPAVENDFSDADFNAADEAQLGEARGAGGRLTDEELILIVGGAILLLILLIILIA